MLLCFQNWPRESQDETTVVAYRILPAVFQGKKICKSIAEKKPNTKRKREFLGVLMHGWDDVRHKISKYKAGSANSCVLQPIKPHNNIFETFYKKAITQLGLGKFFFVISMESQEQYTINNNFFGMIASNFFSLF